MKIYIDLDGTIIDVFDRYCGILNQYLASFGVKIPRSDYVRMRHDGVNEQDMPKQLLGRDIPFDDYRTFKLSRLESAQWLEKDSIIGDISRLKEYPFEYAIITQRNNRDAALAQIEKLGLDRYFDEIIVVAPQKGVNSKAEYLKGKVTAGDCIIGDSRTELECAEILGIRGFFVKSGLFGPHTAENHTIFENYIECIEHIYSHYKNTEV